jgi:hypothetical protein
MAIINKPAIGLISGSLGSSILRSYGKKIVVARRPAHYKKSNTPQAINGRNQFAFLNAFGSAAGKNEFIKEQWKKAITPQQRVNAALIKANKEKISEEKGLAEAMLLPSECTFTPEITGCTMEQEVNQRIFNLTLAPLPPGAGNAYSAALQGILYCSQPGEGVKPIYKFIPAGTIDVLILVIMEKTLFTGTTGGHANREISFTCGIGNCQ